MMTRVIHREQLLNTECFRVEERVIRLDDDTEIIREVIVKPEHYAAILIVDNKGRVLLQQIYHYGNDQYIWGIPRLSLKAENLSDQRREIEVFLRNRFSCASVSTEKLLEAYEDSTIIAGRRVSVYLTRVDGWPASEKSYTVLLPFRSALNLVTTNYMSDVFSVVALLWAKHQTPPMSLHAEHPGFHISSLPVAKVLKEELIYEGKMFDIVVRNVLLANGEKRVFDVIKRTDTVLALVIDTDEMQAIFLQEYFVGLDASPYGLVGGHVKRRENNPESELELEKAMQRELREEIGYRARLKRVLSCHGTLDLSRVLHNFLATELVLDPLDTGDEEYVPKIVRHPIQRLHDPHFVSGILLAEIGALLLNLDNLGMR